MRWKDFPQSRRAVSWLAMLVGVVSFAAMLILEFNKDGLWGWAYAALMNVAAVLFGLAVVSFAWEFFVRQAHGEDLRHHLRLGASVAQSGLQEVGSRSRVNWPELLATANTITVLTDGPEWLEKNMHALRDLARTRALTVVVAVPKTTGGFLSRRAALRGVAVDRLSDPIRYSAERAARLWRDAISTGGLRGGSRLSIVEHDWDLGYEVVAIDEVTIVTLAAPGDVEDIEDRLIFEYKQPVDQYPTRFLRANFEIIAGLNKIDEVEV